MKKLLLVAHLILGIAICAHADPYITSFVSNDPKTSDGKLLISSTASTNLSFSMTVMRAVSSDGTGYEGVLMQYYTIFQASDGSSEVLGGPYDIGTSDFNSGPSVTKSISVTLGPNKVGNIFIRYYYTSMNTGLYNGPLNTGAYYTTLTDPGPPPINNYLDGEFARDQSTGKVYWKIEGNWRHIESVLTLHGLFNYDGYVRYNIYNNPGLPPHGGIGAVLHEDNGLINDVWTGKVYFREGNVIRWIPSEAAFNHYHFRWSMIKDVSYNMQQYQVGPPLPY